MREVSTRACEPLLMACESESVSPKQLVRDLPIEIDTLLGGERWIDWDIFVELVDRFEELAPSIDALERAGAAVAEAPSTQAHVDRLEGISVRDLFEFGGRIRTAACYTNFIRSFDVTDEGHFRIVHQVPKSYRDATSVFQLHGGMIRAMPRILGLPDAVVSAQITRHRAEFLVGPPRDPWRHRVRSRLSRAHGSGPLLQILAENQESMSRQRAAARERFGTASSSARVDLDAFGAPLLVVDVWGEHDLRIFGMNRMMELQTGLEDRDVVGRRIEDAFSLDEAAMLVGMHWRCIGERAALHHDGEVRGRGLRSLLIPVVDARGEVVRVVTSRTVLPDNSREASAVAR